MAILLGIAAGMGFNIPPIIAGLLAFVILVTFAAFLSWRDQYRKATQLEERIKPRLRITGGMEIDQCFVPTLHVFYYRAKLESIGIEPVRKIEASIVSIRKNGEPVQMTEIPRLATNPGPTVIESLKHNIPGFIDVIRTDENHQPELALAWTYDPVAVEADLVSSGHTYEIDVAVASESLPTQMCTFQFVWRNNDPFQSGFEMVMPPLLAPNTEASQPLQV